MTDTENLTEGTNGTIFPEVNPEFIAENQTVKLFKTSQKSGGPYTKAERAKRRKEVSRLHLEVGLPATAIAEAMKINRNTINDDLRLLYRDIANEAPEYTEYFHKQMARLELQRSRVLDYLPHTESIEDKLAIERLVAEIDFRMLGTATKVEYSNVSFWNNVKKTYNLVAEKKGLNYRIASFFELLEISTLARKDLDELYYKLARSNPNAKKK